MPPSSEDFWRGGKRETETYTIPFNQGTCWSNPGLLIQKERKEEKNRVRKEKKLDVRCVTDACTHSQIAGGIWSLGGPAVHHIQKCLEGTFLIFGSNVLFCSRLKWLDVGGQVKVTVTSGPSHCCECNLSGAPGGSSFQSLNSTYGSRQTCMGAASRLVSWDLQLWGSHCVVTLIYVYRLGKALQAALCGRRLTTILACLSTFKKMTFG